MCISTVTPFFKMNSIARPMYRQDSAVLNSQGICIKRSIVSTVAPSRIGPTSLPARIASLSPVGTGHDDGARSSSGSSPAADARGAGAALGAVEGAACSDLLHVQPVVATAN